MRQLFLEFIHDVCMHGISLIHCYHGYHSVTRSNFSCRVRGHHLLDTWDDGTEIAEADPFAFVSDSLADEVNPMWYTNE